jgi:hypothetical protein
MLYKGANMKTDISKKDVEIKKLNTSLYSMKSSQFMTATDTHKESELISSILFDRFTSSAKIELHGCNTAYELYVFDNFAEELSELLYDAWKKDSVIIGHTTKSVPWINGEGNTLYKDQDYRHQERNIYNNGDKISTTNTRGRIGANEINLALKNI